MEKSTIHQEAHMNAQFNTPLDLKNSRRTVAASGPCLNWQADDASAVVKNVTVTTQVGQVATSGPGSSTMVLKAANGWALDVSSSRKLNPGPAHASATLIVTRTNGTTYPDWWEADVLLQP
jgi:hypothetical protein